MRCFEPHAVDAVITTREGGVSTGPYESLNLGLHVGDDAERVVENRRRAAAIVRYRWSGPRQQARSRAICPARARHRRFPCLGRITDADRHHDLGFPVTQQENLAILLRGNDLRNLREQIRIEQR